MKSKKIVTVNREINDFGFGEKEYIVFYINGEIDRAIPTDGDIHNILSHIMYVQKIGFSFIFNLD